MRGIIKWFNHDRGFGFVKSEDHGYREAFVHCETSEQRGHEPLSPGDPVEFEIKHGPHGPRGEITRRLILEPLIVHSDGAPALLLAPAVHGVVKWFNNEKGYGFIKTPDGEDVFVHYTAIQAYGFRSLGEGDDVEFDMLQGPRGLQAGAVRRLEEEREDEIAQTTTPMTHESLAVTVVDGTIRLVSVTAEGAFRFLDAWEHLHGILYLAGRETIAYADAVAEFEDIINASNPAEKAIQDFFERHPDFLLRNDHRAAVAHVVLERQSPLGPLIPDFVLKPLEPCGLADLLEIKRPRAKVFVLKNNRIRYSAAVLEACAQLREYSEYFESPRNRELIHDRYGLLAFRPRLFVVIGRRGTVDPIIARRVASDIALPVIVDTYDDILTRVKFRLEKMRRGGDLPG